MVDSPEWPGLSVVGDAELDSVLQMRAGNAE